MPDEDIHMHSPAASAAANMSTGQPPLHPSTSTPAPSSSTSGTRRVSSQQLLEQQIEAQKQQLLLLTSLQEQTAMQMQQHSVLTNFLLHQKACTIDMPKYKPKDSLRAYIRAFENQAKEIGITDKNILVPMLSKLMPDDIRMWISSLSLLTRQSWDATVFEILSYYAISEDEENRLAMDKLRKTVQQAKQHIREHTTSWFLQYRVIAASNAIFPVSQARTMFIQSFRDVGVRATLTSAISHNFQINMHALVDLALRIGENINPTELSTAQEQPLPDKDDPMEVDYIRDKQHKQNHKPFKKHKFQKKVFKKYDGVPRLYDRQGNPVCGHCQGSHRNIDCDQETSSHVSTLETGDDSDDLVEIGVIQAHSVNHIKAASRQGYTPTSQVVIAGHQVSALWDSGSAITVISQHVCQLLKLNVDHRTVVQYVDVNKVAKSTVGTVSLNLFGDTIKLHVIDGLARELILGYNVMQRWNAILVTNANHIILTVNNARFKVSVSSVLREDNSNVFASETTHLPEVQQVLDKYSTVLANKHDKPGVTDLVEFVIDTGDHPPVYTSPRPYHPRIQKQIDEKFEELIKNGICSKVDFTDWGSPVTVVPKPDGSLRLCGNYVKLNAVTKPIKYPFVNLHMALQSLGNAKVFSKVDLLSSYHQIPIREEHKVKSALVTTTSTYIFHTMGMGMRNCPAVFQSLMDRVLGEMRYQSAIGYQDDVIVFSATLSQHVKDLERLLDKLQRAKLTANLDKCEFAVDTVKFLGFIVSKDGVHADPDKVAPITKLPAPTNLKELERFLGLTGVYNKFISQYQILAEPLRRLKIKDAPFVWGDEQQQAFLTLKAKLAELPTLRQPDFSRQFELHCDAANTAGVAVVLCQRVDGTPYPLAFASRALNKHERNYSIRELEALAIVFGVKKFRVYLECDQFLVFTDHSSLLWLLSTNQDKQPRLWRWCLFLQSYDFVVKYIPGKNNHAPDALSRSTVFAIAISTTLDKLLCHEEQVKDLSLAKYFTKVSSDKSFVVAQGVLYKLVPKPRNLLQNNRFKVVPQHLVAKVLDEFHNNRLTGHGGVGKTVYNLKRNQLWWPRMNQDVLAFIKTCTICQQVKGNRSYIHHQGVTHGEFPFHRVAIDYFGPLPASTSGNCYVMVVMDTFSKYVEVYPMKSTLSMEMAQIFYNKFVTRHGFPQEIMSDNGAPMGSEFIKELATFAGITHCYTPPHHPESNGIVERFMQTLRLMILSYVEQQDINSNWDSKLRVIRFVYNNMWNAATGYAPFEIVHGRAARTALTRFKDENLPKLYRGSVPTPQSQFATSLKSDMETIVEHVYNKLSVLKDENGPVVALKEGDLVYMFNQAISSKKKPRKLSMDWMGPRKVVKVISNTRYDVQEHDTRLKKVHRNVHISFLKKHYA